MNRRLAAVAAAVVVPFALTACGGGGPATGVVPVTRAPLAQSAERAPLSQPRDPATPVGNPTFQVGSPGKSTCDPDAKHGTDDNHDGRSHHERCTTPAPSPTPAPPPPTPMPTATPMPCGCQW